MSLSLSALGLAGQTQAMAGREAGTGVHTGPRHRVVREAHWGSQAVSWRKRALTDDEGAQGPPRPPREAPRRQQLLLAPSSCSLPPSSSSRLRGLLSIRQNHHQVLPHLLTPPHPNSICLHHFLPQGQIKCCLQEGTFQTLLTHPHHGDCILDLGH